jgi:uncharacterized RDD family membrane protein YckC
MPVLAFAILQWVMIATRGQTLGKRWLHIKIVRESGAPVDFVTGVVLREWVLYLTNGIPSVGRFVGLIDALWIFAEGSRCLHDKVARTRVVSCMPTSF